MHPIAIQLGPIAIHWYGVLVAAGFLAGIWTASIHGRSVGIKTEVMMDLGIWMIVAGIVGARIFYVIGNWEEFSTNLTEIVRVDHGGLVFYGGFILSTLTAIWFVRRNHLNFWQLVDACAPSLALGHAFGRIGCFMHGCCFGKVCSLSWAVRFPRTFDDHGRLLPPYGLPVHPTQIYESIGNLLIFAGLWVFYSKRKFDGQVFWLYVVVYALFRFSIEFFRGDYTEYFLGNRLAPGQMVAVIMVAVAAVFLWRLPRTRLEVK
ncbi:MAG: prolipoprotein diacylglyceryl transferase [Verrucomicrobiae bacterium]|nr:prolipoprotein diacylglyceryl transferase [Verrucomicrobiae bacterium]